MDKDLQILLKNNNLIKAKYDLTEFENRIINLVFLKSQKSGGLAEITLQEFRTLTNNTSYHTLPAVAEHLDRLMKNQVSEIHKGGWLKTVILSSYEFIEYRNVFRIKLAETFRGLIESYKEDGFSAVSFTKYATLQGVSSQRIYELIRVDTVNKYNKTHSSGFKESTHAIHELKEYLYLTDKYKVFKDFRRRVIEPAVEEIVSKGLMEIKEIKYNKLGRRVDSVTFIVKDLEPAMYNFKPIEVDDFKIDDSELTELEKLSIQAKLSIKTIEKLYKEFGYQELKKGCEILSNTKKVTAPLKYLKGILNNRKEQNKGKTHQQLGLDSGVDMNSGDGIIGWD
ncbi:MAG: RepB family plasmid replication initiator protein [Sarcina sp.]